MTESIHEWIGQALAALNAEGGRRVLEFLQRQRWFGGKGEPLAGLRVSEASALIHGTDRFMLAFVEVEYRDGRRECYVMPLMIRGGIEPGDGQALVELAEPFSGEWVCDATQHANIWMALFDEIVQNRQQAGVAGWLRGRSLPHRLEALRPLEAQVLSAEQSNTSVVLDRRVILKLIRKVEAGMSPDSEMLEFLTTRAACPYVPPLLGVLTYDARGADPDESATVAVLQRFVPDSHDGWDYTLAHLRRLSEEGLSAIEHGSSVPRAVADVSGPFLTDMRRLGEITGELHVALASQNEPETFRPEPITAQDAAQWQALMVQHSAAVCRDLAALPLLQRSALQLMNGHARQWALLCGDRFGDLQLLPRSGAYKIRHHGDYHLGQVLKTSDGFIVIDFGGEPARPLVERRAKVCPLKDVGGMLRSFSYASQTVLKQRRDSSVVALMTEWERATRTAFLDGYRASTKPGEAVFLPATWEACLRVIHVYELDKALYEVAYEMHNRPEWISIPLTGVRLLLEGPLSRPE